MEVLTEAADQMYLLGWEIVSNELMCFLTKVVIAPSSVFIV